MPPSKPTWKKGRGKLGLLAPLLGTRVAPVVRREIEKRTAAPA